MRTWSQVLHAKNSYSQILDSKELIRFGAERRLILLESEKKGDDNA